MTGGHREDAVRTPRPGLEWPPPRAQREAACRRLPTELQPPTVRGRLPELEATGPGSFVMGSGKPVQRSRSAPELPVCTPVQAGPEFPEDANCPVPM